MNKLKTDNRMENKETIVKDPSGGMSPGAVGFSGLRERDMETVQATGKRLPYMAPVIETHLVELEGGIAQGSVKGGNMTIEDYVDADKPIDGGDIQLEF